MEEVKETWEGKVLTGALITSAILIAVSQRKEKAFWLGVGAMFLIQCSVKTYGPKK